MFLLRHWDMAHANIDCYSTKLWRSYIYGFKIELTTFIITRYNEDEIRQKGTHLSANSTKIFLKNELIIER